MVRGGTKKAKEHRRLECPNRVFRLCLGQTILENMNHCIFHDHKSATCVPTLDMAHFNDNPCAKLRLGRSNENVAN